MPDNGHQLLVDARTLAAHFEDPRWVLFDCRFALADPVAGHIPGTISMPLTGNLDQDGRFLPPE